MRREFKKLGVSHPKLSYRSIAKLVGVHSPTTISQWDTKDMTVEAITRRLMRKARRRKLSEKEERILVGWVVLKDLTLESSTSEKIKEFAHNYLHQSISSSYLTSFMKRHHLSLKLVGMLFHLFLKCLFIHLRKR
jgi:transposase